MDLCNIMVKTMNLIELNNKNEKKACYKLMCIYKLNQQIRCLNKMKSRNQTNEQNFKKNQSSVIQLA
jgi:hypothetical protein